MTILFYIALGTLALVMLVIFGVCLGAMYIIARDWYLGWRARRLGRQRRRDLQHGRARRR